MRGAGKGGESLAGKPDTMVAYKVCLVCSDASMQEGQSLLSTTRWVCTGHGEAFLVPGLFHATVGGIAHSLWQNTGYT